MPSDASVSRKAGAGPQTAAGSAQPGADRRAGPDQGRRRSVAGRVEQLGVPAVLVVLVVAFSLALPSTFPTSANLSGILSTEDVSIVLALGGIIPLICGEFDLSIGYVLGFTSMEVAVLTLNEHWNVWLATIATILTGAAIGLVNAFLVRMANLSSFIATLASGTVLNGITLLISRQTIVTGTLPQGFVKLGTGGPGNVPPAVYIALAIAIVLYYVLEHTPGGRRLEALGQGRDAARLAGVKVGRLVMVSLVSSGLIAGIAGVLNTATQGSADPSVGPDFLLPALAAAFLGATTIRPGRFNVIGTVLSVLLLAVGVNGLSQMGAPQWVSPVFNGGVLIVAVGAAQVRARRT